MDLVLRYANQTDLAAPVADVMRRIGAREDEPYGSLPIATHEPRQAPAQTHRLTDADTNAIFACYRDGIGPRELASRFGITERAIKYLLKKHGVQRTRSGSALLGGRS